MESVERNSGGMEHWNDLYPEIQLRIYLEQVMLSSRLDDSYAKALY